MTIGKRIKLLRTELGFTQKILADKIGLAPKMVSFYENEERIPPMDIVLKLTNIFDVSSDYLLGRTDMRHPDSDYEWRYPPVSNRLGTILKNFREQKGISIQAFSQKLGVDETTYINIESGKYSQNYKLPPEFVRQLSTVTGYEVDYILGAINHTTVPTNETISINNVEYPMCRSEANFHFKTRLEELCRENGINPENVEDRIGITKHAFMDIQWTRMPSLSELLRIAYSLGVSMDYLIGKTDIRMSSLDSDELELILDYRDCPPVYKENIRKRAHDLSIDAMLKDEKSSVAADDGPKKTGTYSPK